ncbi:MAG: pilus assembly protein TadG-related protein [Desulfuromonadales bacterium]
MTDERGAVMVLFGLLIVVLVSFGALAVDIGHLAVVRNELQNAADAGALAGAAVLYLADGTVNPNANQVAYDTARRNASEGVAVEIDWTSGTNGLEIQRGHWSFTQKAFQPNDSLAQIDIWKYTTEELDVMPEFINAVRLVARREDHPAASFLAQIMGFNSFQSEASAVAYLGFTGDLTPGEADAPIAICRSSIVNDEGEYTCNIGRMINSSAKDDSNTGAWTNYSSGCSDTFNASDLANIIDFSNNESKMDCDGSNPNTIEFGVGLSVGGGQVGGGFDSFRKCGGFFTDKELSKGLGPRREQPWSLTVPVIDCPTGDSNPSGCLRVVGAVTIHVVMITSEFSTGDFSQIPPKMGTWDINDYPGVTGKALWVNFVDHFGLEVNPEIPAYESAGDGFYQKTVYATRECEPYAPVGRTGGANYGVLAKYPALVQ